MIEASEIKELTQRIEKLSMEEAMGLLVDLFPGEIIFSTSFGQEDQVITQKIAANKFPIEVFTLDTGRLFYETYDLWSRTIVKYGLSIKPFYPETAAVEELISTNGINGFYQSVENRKSCEEGCATETSIEW